MDKTTEDARTLAAWCSRSDAGYNAGAWQAALLLRSKEFRVAVAREVAAKGLDPAHPAMRQWSTELIEPARIELGQMSAQDAR